MPRYWSYAPAGALLALAATCAESQELLDQIAARVESDIILLSEVRTLSRYQMQVDGKQVEDFYQQAVVPRAKARNQAPPPLDASREYIQEALVQRGINEQAEVWLKESRARLHVEKFLKDSGK